MEQVDSADGTPIAYERHGAGHPVILVGGALCDRGSHRPLAERLAPAFTAITYDRRGRGDSGDAPAYAVEREVEDLDAIITAAGGAASVYGHSSGAGLALHAAAAGLPITQLVLHEPPFNVDDAEQRREAREYAASLERTLADGRHADAVALFLATAGAPPAVIEGMRGEPWWAGMVAMAPTLAYESAVMGDRTRGGTIPVDALDRVTVPTLVLTGGASPQWMADVGERLADGVRSGRHVALDGEEHVVAPEVLAPVLTDYLARVTTGRP